MAIDKIFISDKRCVFCFEANPDNSGVRLVVYRTDGKLTWVATIIDCGDKFVLAISTGNGIEVKSFNPTRELMFRNGQKPPLFVDEQIEVVTQYGKHMLVRYTHSKSNPKGAIISYSDGIKLWSVALCMQENDELKFYCSE